MHRLQHRKTTPTKTPPSSRAAPAPPLRYLPTPPVSVDGSPHRARPLPGAPPATKTDQERPKSLDQLKHYLSTDSLFTALNSAPHWQLCFHPIPDSESGPLLEALSHRQYNSIRLDYNPLSATLRLWMPTPIHECMQAWASDMMTRINDYLLTRAPDRRLRGVVATKRLAISMYTPPDGPDAAYLPPFTTTAGSKKRKAPIDSDPVRQRKKPAAIRKTADYSWTLPGDGYPRVVFEAGWTESAPDLADDAEQWLVKTGGRTRVVVVLLFVEKDSPLSRRTGELREKYSQLHKEEEEPQEVEEQEEDDGEAEGRDNNNRAPPSSPLSTAPSTASDHLAERDAIDPDDWVGRVTVHSTIWRYTGSGATGHSSRDARVIIYPDGSTRNLHPTMVIGAVEALPPAIYLGDVYDRKRKQKEEGDEEEEEEEEPCAWEFDWKGLYKELQVARREYAVDRKLDAVKTVRKEFGV